MHRENKKRPQRVMNFGQLEIGNLDCKSTSKSTKSIYAMSKYNDKIPTQEINPSKSGDDSSYGALFEDLPEIIQDSLSESSDYNQSVVSENSQGKIISKDFCH